MAPIHSYLYTYIELKCSTLLSMRCGLRHEVIATHLDDRMLTLMQECARNHGKLQEDREPPSIGETFVLELVCNMVENCWEQRWEGHMRRGACNHMSCTGIGVWGPMTGLGFSHFTHVKLQTSILLCLCCITYG